MKLITVILLSIILAADVPVSNRNEQPQVTFSIGKLFSTVHGHLKKVDYTINLEKESLGFISGAAEVVSINTNNSTRDKHLQNEDWFDSEKYPLIEVFSKKITMKSAGKYLGTFEIRIKGKSHVMDIPFSVENLGSNKKLTANFTLSISEFNIGGGVLNYFVGDNVTVNIDLVF